MLFLRGLDESAAGAAYFCPNVTDFETSVTRPGPYPTVMLFIYVWNQTKSDTVLSWSTEVMSRSCCYYGSSLFTAVTHVALSATCKWLSKGIARNGAIHYAGLTANMKAKGILFIATLYFHWKPVKSRPNPNIISNYLFEPIPHRQAPADTI